MLDLNIMLQGACVTARLYKGCGTCRLSDKLEIQTQKSLRISKEFEGAVCLQDTGMQTLEVAELPSNVVHMHPPYSPAFTNATAHVDCGEVHSQVTQELSMSVFSTCAHQGSDICFT